MKEIKVGISAEKSYSIIVREGLVLKDGMDDFCDVAGKFLIVTDENIYAIYADFLSKFSSSLLVLPPGESEKTFVNVEKICRKAVAIGLDRSSSLIAFGGGVVGDMTGFAASIYMRGIKYFQIPTTVLAMVDSSVGGKTGVDLPEGKNLIGSFWQPSQVFMDTSFIKTLPEREIRCGLAEIIKYGMILDKALFTDIEQNIVGLLNRDLTLYERIIERACSIKASVVEKDEKESGVRAILNYGHSFGHAIEKLSGFATFSHGEAVGLGMRISAKFAVLSGKLTAQEEARQNLLIDKAGLPSSISISPEALYSAMFSDKKAQGGKLRIILPRAIGEAEIIDNPAKDIIIEAIGKYCDYA